MKAAKKRAYTRNSDYDVRADIANLRKAFVNATNDVRGRTGDILYDVRGKTGELIQDSMKRVKDKTSDLQDAVTNYAQEKPLKTMGFAMLAGVIIGYIIHR